MTKFIINLAIYLELGDLPEGCEDVEKREKPSNILVLLHPDHWYVAKYFQKYSNVFLPQLNHTCSPMWKIHRIPGKIKSEIIFPRGDSLKILRYFFNPPHSTRFCHDPESIDMIFVSDPVMCNFNFKPYKNAIKVYWAQDSVYPSSYYNHMLSIGLENYDVVFVAHKKYISDYSRYTNNVFWLPYAYDPDIYHPLDTKKTYDVAFIGSMDAERRATMDAVRSNYSNLKVFSGELWQLDANYAYNQSKVVLNLARIGEMNWRTFEVLGSGSFLLNSFSDELTEIFSDGTDFVMFKNKRDLIEKIGYFINNDSLSYKIAQTGHENVANNHTLEERVKLILSKYSIME